MNLSRNDINGSCRYLVIYLSMTIVLAFLIMSCTSDTQEKRSGSSKQAENRGLLLSEIQNRDGVYLKRDDKFFSLDNAGLHEVKDRRQFGRRADGSWLVGNLKTTNTLYDTDQIVYVGQKPEVYGLNFRGFTNDQIFKKFSGSVRVWDQRGLSEAYTHINGAEIRGNNGFQRHFINTRLERVISDTIHRIDLLTGDKGQEFTFGRFQGTNWQETKRIINSEAYSATRIQSSFETTLNGYFVLLFSTGNYQYLNFRVREMDTIGYGVDMPRDVSKARIVKVANMIQ